jgi:hypothetical protein
VFEKNYRLQDIQLSKSVALTFRLPASFSSYRVALVLQARRGHETVSRSRGRKPHQLIAWPDTGGEYRARTGDLLVANQALSQLS